MEIEHSLLYQQEPTTGPYPEPDISSSHPTLYFLQTHLNICFPSTPYWEDNIRMDLREIGWEGVDWMYLAQDNDQ
jgi:hypothetical protein